MSDLDKQIAADPRHPCSQTMERVFELEKKLEAERIIRRWALEQLRLWWQGAPRDTSNVPAALEAIDQMERKLEEFV